MWKDLIQSIGALSRRPTGPEEKAPTVRPGLKSLNAVITVRHLLREEKQGTTTLRLSFTNYFSRCAALLGTRRHRNNAKFPPVRAHRPTRKSSINRNRARAHPAPLSHQSPS